MRRDTPSKSPDDFRMARNERYASIGTLLRKANPSGISIKTRQNTMAALIQLRITKGRMEKSRRIIPGRWDLPTQIFLLSVILTLIFTRGTLFSRTSNSMNRDDVRIAKKRPPLRKERRAF